VARVAAPEQPAAAGRAVAPEPLVEPAPVVKPEQRVAAVLVVAAASNSRLSLLALRSRNGNFLLTAPIFVD
jgi:hypothetical protein